MSHRHLLATVVTVALVLLPQAATAAPAPIEGFARYEPQTHCSPKPKPGTLKLAAWLQKTYRGTGSLGISARCKGGGVSEHKEGRAFDWAVSVHSARDRGYVQDFFRRIFATDADGNADALARRMGIMYLIWNDHIYSSYYGFRSRPYRSAGCKKVKRCSDTLRHRNHVHISLSRRGGAGLTSWYTGGKVTTPPTGTPPTGTPAPTPAPTPPPTAHPPAPKPAPEPAPSPRPGTGGVLSLPRGGYARLVVPTDGRAVVSRFKLAARHGYVLTVGGLYTYGAPQQVADAVCSWAPRGAAWVPNPEAAVARAHGSLDLRVNGTRPFGASCHTGSHVYRATFTPRRTGPLTLAVANRGASVGALVVTVSQRGTNVTRALPSYPALRPAPAPSRSVSRGHGLLAERVAVPAAAPATTDEEVQAGARYRITVAGTVDLGGGVASDGQCLAVRGTWYPQASLDPRFPGAAHGRLYVDGVPLAAGGGCGTRLHPTTWTATRTGRVTFALWDPLAATDDRGSLEVLVQRLTPIPTPAAADPGQPPPTWSRHRQDWFRVDSASPAGTVSTMRLRAGQTVQVVVQGVQRSGSTTADASCVETRAGWLPRDPAIALDQDPLDLWVDGRPVTWRPMGTSSGACSDEHAYTAWVTATKDGPLRLAVLDLDHTDNDGTLEVTLLPD